jgi:hypothetical protein
MPRRNVKRQNDMPRRNVKRQIGVLKQSIIS